MCIVFVVDPTQTSNSSYIHCIVALKRNRSDCSEVQILFNTKVNPQNTDELEEWLELIKIYLAQPRTLVLAKYPTLNFLLD